MTTTTLTPDALLLRQPPFPGLLAALDGGDDSALLPLADALEEAGDPRAAGLRFIGFPDGPRPDEAYRNSGYVWWVFHVSRVPCPATVSRVTFDRLRGGDETRRNDDQRIYDHRSRALLALAEALTAAR